MIRNSIFARRIRELKICISDMEFDIYGLELYIKRSEIFFDNLEFLISQPEIRYLNAGTYAQNASV